MHITNWRIYKLIEQKTQILDIVNNNNIPKKYAICLLYMLEMLRVNCTIQN